MLTIADKVRILNQHEHIFTILEDNLARLNISLDDNYLIAGGSVVKAATWQSWKIRDYDVFYNETDFPKFRLLIAELEKKKWSVKYQTNRSMCLENSNLIDWRSIDEQKKYIRIDFIPVQKIVASEVLDSFDIDICRLGITRELMVLDKTGISEELAITTKLSVIPEKVGDIAKTIYRMMKYIKRGFTFDEASWEWLAKLTNYNLPANGWKIILATQNENIDLDYISQIKE